MMDTVKEVYIRLYESTESDDPVSQWSAEVSFDEAVSRPRIVRGGKFHFGKRFGEPEKFRFPPPIGEATVVLAAQDEVGTVPHFIPLKEMDVKIGGNEIDRLRRWYRQGKRKVRRSRRCTRRQKGSPNRGSMRRSFPVALSDSTARIGLVAHLLCYRANGGSVHQAFSSRIRRGFSARSTSFGKPAGHPERLALARHSSDAESYAEETVRRRRGFLEARLLRGGFS
jgi:hypothetical protein